MLGYILRRVGIMIPTLFLISIISFVVIQLPPGDFLTSYVAQLRSQGDIVNDEEIKALQERYGLGEPMHVQYVKLITGIIFYGDWGQ